MQNYPTITSNISQTGTNHAVQTITPDYTGIYCFCGTIFIISMIIIIVIHHISEKWRIDNFKLKQEEIKQNYLSIRELNSNLKQVKILLEGLLINGNNNTIDS